MAEQKKRLQGYCSPARSRAIGGRTWGTGCESQSAMYKHATAMAYAKLVNDAQFISIRY